MSTEQEQPKPDSDTSLKLAIAMALVRSKLLQKPPTHQQHSSTYESNALKWKRKAKERKQELLRLREDLKQAEDNSQCDLFGQAAICKCYFFDNLGTLSPHRFGNESDGRFGDVLRRGFLRQVRLNERRRKRESSKQAHCFSDCSSEDEIEQLRASVDFLVELCDTVNPVKVEETKFLNWSHQAVDFILAALKNRLSIGKNIELLEGIVCSLIVRLVRRMCTASNTVRLVRRMCTASNTDEKTFPFADSWPSATTLGILDMPRICSHNLRFTNRHPELHHLDADVQFRILHLIRNLGSECYIGQRVILSVSQRIAVLGESLLSIDPFDDAFPNMHDCMYMMIQLTEFLISDYLLTWSSSQVFDTRLFEEGVTSILHAKKALELLESRNGLYVLYMDRVIGDLGKKWGQISSVHTLNPDILANLMR